MNCKEYMELTIPEKVQLIGKVNHLIANDTNSFLAAQSMIREAENNGLFEKVTIVPKTYLDNKT